MATVGVVGAHVTLGARVWTHLEACGHTVIPAADTPPAATGATWCGLARDPDLADYLGMVDVVIIVHTATRDRLVTACIAERRPFIDLASEQHQVEGYFDRLADTPCVVGAGLIPGLSELLIGAASRMMAHPVQAVTAAYTFPDGNVPPASVRGSAGRRLAVADTLLTPGMQLRNGRWHTDPIGDQRQLVWFPRPVGPQQGLAWPSVTRFLLTDALPEVQHFTQYMVMGSWRAELAQACANQAHRPRLAAWLRRRAANGGHVPDVTELRFACVVETRDQASFRRAWAYGRDPYFVSAVLAGRWVDALANHTVQQPTSYLTAVAQHDVLDDLTETTGLRWSVSDERSLPR